MKWININEKLPKDNNTDGGTDYLVTVKCDTWKSPKTMVMEWEETEIRGKQVQRWKWNNRIKINEWVVTHWMEFPKPAMVE
jgi:hypothetical protein